jgi:RNA polymerase sigma-70 factor (ECF subfamily)
MVTHWRKQYETQFRAEWRLSLCLHKFVTIQNTANLNDNELISQVVQGDQRAFLALYDRYSSTVYALALHMMNDPMMAEEVLQDTFLKLWSRSRQYLTERGPLLTWLLTIARRTALDRLRLESRRPTLSERNDPDLLWEMTPEPETTSEEARWRSLYLVVQSLPEEHRQVIELAYYQGMSQSEIAAVLDLPLGTVKTRLRTGMNRLRHQWLEDENH